jgi:hypothetical protein
MNTQNRVTLKSIKVLESRSEETHCYTANVYFDGKKIAEVGNGGHGACDDYYPTNKAGADKMQEYIKTLPDHVYDFGNVPASLDYICSEAINDWYAKKDFAKICRKWSWYFNDWDGTYYQYHKRHPLEVVREHLSKDGAEPKFLNDLTVDEYKALVLIPAS